MSINFKRTENYTGIPSINMKGLGTVGVKSKHTPPPFLPDQLSNLLYWFDPTQGLTLNGSQIIKWDKRAGSESVSMSLIKNPDGYQYPPPTVATYNGKTILSFDKSLRQQLVSNIDIEYKCATMYVVCLFSGTTFKTDGYTTSGLGSKGSYRYSVLAGRNSTLVVDDGTGKLDGGSNLSFSFNVLHIFAWTSPVYLLPAGRDFIGLNCGLGSAYHYPTYWGEMWNGYIGDIIGLSPVATAEQDNKVMTYLADKWGVTLVS